MTNRHSSPPPRPAPIPASISNPILHQDATRPSSPPRTPQNRRTRIVPSHTAPRVSTRTSRRETFLDDVTPIEGVRGHDGGDERDPHDLAFSPKHVTRASVVDNMLMALDQFSNPASGTVASREPPSASLRYNSIFGRRRANTFSSDISSDNESKPDEHSIPHTFSRTQRSNSNSNYHYPRGLQPVPSLYEEEESNTRHRVFDSQRAFARPDQRHGRKSGKSSGSSSVDLGQVLSNCNLGPAGNRRSQSFDFGSNRPRFPILENDAHARSNSYNLADEIEAAPTPIVHAGPRRGHSPIRHNPAAPLSPIYPSTPGGSKSHTKSSKHQGGRKGRAGTMGNASTKGRDELRDLHENLENLPPMPTYFAPQTHSPTLPPHKPSIASSADLPLHSKERHGFFRRVFGPKNASATTLPPTEGENVVSQEAVTVTPTEESFRASVSSAKVHKPPPLKELSSKNPTVPKEQQTITKKSSAFFRRRKKSVCEQMPTSLPLNSLQTGKVEAAEPSPVSSLRQVMNPYLGGPALASPQFAVGNESPQAFHTAPSSFSKTNDVAFVKDEKAQGVTSQSDQSTPNHESLHNQRLRIPRPDHQDSTFLADSSGTEESNSKSRQNSPNRSSDERSRSGPSNARHNQATEGLLSPRNPSASTTNSRGTNPSSGSQTTRSPTSPAHPDFTAPYFVAPTKVSRPSNLRLQQDTLNPSRRGSSTKEQGTSLAANSPRPSDSDASVYKSAPTTPIVTPNEDKSRADAPSPAISITASPKTIPVQASAEEDQEQALKIFENRDEHLDPGEVSAWLGDPGEARERVRMAYMKLFDWTNMDVLTGLRGLCERIALKGETQQVDRMLDAFSQRWCECNPMHGFKSADVVHTICYSILLLNTDLHLADIGQKMTRAQFIRNTLPTIRHIASDSTIDGATTIRAGTWPKPDPTSELSSSLPRSPTLPAESRPGRSSIDEAIPFIGSTRAGDRIMRESSGDGDHSPNDAGPLVTAPFVGSIRAWESQIETVLKRVYTSISRDKLPLFGAKAETVEASNNLLNITGNILRRSPSTLSKAASEHSRGRAVEGRLGTGRWVSKPRSRPQLNPISTVGSTRTSMDEASSAWSPSMSSTWSKASVGKTLTSMSVDSVRSEGLQGEYQKSIGFANALSQAIIREDSTGMPTTGDEGMKVAPLLDDESLELSGAPWAKEGSLKHKHHLDGVERRAKGRNWNDCFAVIEKGWMRLFSFSLDAKSLRAKAKDRAKAGGVVGGGNWMDSAEEVWKFLLRQTIASALPDPGYSKARPFVWALSLPTGAVHLFQVGTPDIVKEFVSTANYWSARLSKEPMMGGISTMEYGWSDAVVNRALIHSESQATIAVGGPRPSMQSSIRSSLDQVGAGMRPKLPGDKIAVYEWTPPQQSMVASQLMEVDQLRTLQTYVKHVEEELAKHTELRPAMQLAFSTRHPNTTKAMANWENKSSYLLREIVKFKTYVDSLIMAQKEKEKILMNGDKKNEKT